VTTRFHSSDQTRPMERGEASAEKWDDLLLHPVVIDLKLLLLEAFHVASFVVGHYYIQSNQVSTNNNSIVLGRGSRL